MHEDTLMIGIAIEFSAFRPKDILVIFDRSDQTSVEFKLQLVESVAD